VREPKLLASLQVGAATGEVLHLVFGCRPVLIGSGVGGVQLDSLVKGANCF